MNLFYRSVLVLLHLCGYLLGWIARLLNIEYARVSEINIKLVYPELSPDEVDLLLRKSLGEFGKLVFEMLFNWCIPTDVFKSQIRNIQGEVFFKTAVAKKRGIIIVHPHLGNWEIFNYILGPYNPRALYKPVNNRFWNRLITRSRERPGTIMVPITAIGVRELYRVLDRGGIVKTFPDQLPDGSGRLVVDFLGIPARTGTLLPRMIQKTHPVVICCYAHRLSKAHGFDIHLVPAVDEIYSDDLETATAALNKSMEHLIRLAPEQYLWGYKRFKHTIHPALYARK